MSDTPTPEEGMAVLAVQRATHFVPFHLLASPDEGEVIPAMFVRADQIESVMVGTYHPDGAEEGWAVFIRTMTHASFVTADGDRSLGSANQHAERVMEAIRDSEAVEGS